MCSLFGDVSVVCCVVVVCCLLAVACCVLLVECGYSVFLVFAVCWWLCGL